MSFSTTLIYINYAEAGIPTPMIISYDQYDFEHATNWHAHHGQEGIFAALFRLFSVCAQH